MPEKRIFTQEEIDTMKRLYNEDVTVREIAKHFNCSTPFMSKTLKEAGVNVINKTKLIYFDVEKDIVPLINEGKSLTEIAPLFKTERHTLARYLKKNGYEVVNKQNETKFNENAFDCIDTEEKAYWLGFMYADGYMAAPRKSGKHEYSIELSLTVSDISHLYKFQKFLEFNHDRVKVGRVYCKNGEFYRCRLSWSNKHMWNVLNNYGCTPNKSLTLEFPSDDIFHGDKDKLIISFIKGYFDGDGCLSYSYGKTTMGKRYSCIASILGTKNFLEGILKHSQLKGTIRLENKGRENSSGKTYGLFIHQTETQKLIDLFYTNSDIYLDRKYKRAMFFNDRVIDEEELEKFLNEEQNNKTFKENLCK